MTESIERIIVPGEPLGKVLFQPDMRGRVLLMIWSGDEGPVSISSVFLSSLSKWTIEDSTNRSIQSVDLPDLILAPFASQVRFAAGKMGVAEPVSKRWGSSKKSDIVDLANRIDLLDPSAFGSSLVTAMKRSSLGLLKGAYRMAISMNSLDEVRSVLDQALASDVMDA